MKTLLIIVLAAALAFSLYRLGGVERQNYAMIVGLCKFDAIGVPDFGCLATAEPRTSRLWDIYYGLQP